MDRSSIPGYYYALLSQAGAHVGKQKGLFYLVEAGAMFVIGILKEHEGWCLRNHIAKDSL